jgi:predicted RNA-binding protein with RPS1 domain
VSALSLSLSFPCLSLAVPRADLGVTVEVVPNMFGTLHITDLHDDWRRSPLDGITVGGHVRVKVVEVSRNKGKW